MDQIRQFSTETYLQIASRDWRTLQYPNLSSILCKTRVSRQFYHLCKQCIKSLQLVSCTTKCSLIQACAIILQDNLVILTPTIVPILWQFHWEFSHSLQALNLCRNNTFPRDGPWRIKNGKYGHAISRKSDAGNDNKRILRRILQKRISVL